jgi:hypothetical protein
MSVPRFRASLHKPQVADDALAEGYLALIAFKESLDLMEELPDAELHKLYKQTMKTIDAVTEASQETHQFRSMLRRYVAR